MRPIPALALCATLTFAILAGCLQTPKDDAGATPVAEREPAWALRAVFGNADPDATGRIPSHDHSNRSLHKGLSTPNFEVVGHVELNSTYFGTAAGATACGDVSSGPRQIATTDSHSTDVGLTVVDVTDRAKPEVLGELVLPFAFTYDNAIFADARYAVIAVNPDFAMDKPAGTADWVPFHAQWRTPCGTFPVGSNVDRVPYGYGSLLVDLKDPTNPVVADFFEYPAGRNVHSISTAMVGGTRWVATSGLMAVPCTVPGFGGIPPPGTPQTPSVPCQPVPRYGNLMSHYDFLTVEETQAGPRLKPYAFYVPSDQTHLDPSNLYLSNGHTDATVELHPLTNQTVAYLADWDGGMHIVRLDKANAMAPDGLPGQVTPLSSWGAVPGGDPTQSTGHIHSVRPVDGLRLGHHYLVVGQEVVGRPSARPSGQIAILDVTDPTHPIPRARWTLPVDVIWPGSMGLAFSTHYPILVNDTLCVSAYHSGVWAVDARMSNWPDLPTVGVYLPDIEPSSPPVARSNTPSVEEVLDLGDGTLLAYDGDSGAYILRFHPEDKSVPPALPWPNDTFIG
ncbi:MAG: hypothetical protein ABR562_00370 [Thermoplasmatota archaeon]